MSENKHLKLKSEFENFAGEQVSLEFEFRQPSTAEVEKTNNALPKSLLAASRNLCIWTVKEEQKEALLSAIDKYPMIAQTFVDAIYARMGAGSLGK